MNALARWMKRATPVDRRNLARKANTSLGTLRQIAGGYRKTNVTADLAARIDRGVQAVNHQSIVRPRLPEVRRESLCPACASCEFAKQCRNI